MPVKLRSDEDFNRLAALYLKQAGGDEDEAVRLMKQDFRPGGVAFQFVAGIPEGMADFASLVAGPLNYLLGTDADISQELSPARFGAPEPQSRLETAAREGSRIASSTLPIAGAVAPAKSLPAVAGLEMGLGGMEGALQADIKERGGQISPHAAMALGAGVGIIAPGPEDLGKTARLADMGAGTRLQTELTSRFTPLRKAERLLLGQSPELDMAARFELLAAAPVRAAGDVEDYNRRVLVPIKGMLDELEPVLAEGRPINLQRYSPEQQQAITQSLQEYQQIVDAALNREVISGRLGQEELAALSTPAQRLDQMYELTGVPRERRGLNAFAEILYRSRIQSEGNLRMRQLAELAEADSEGQFFRLAKPSTLEPQLEASAALTAEFKKFKSGGGQGTFREWLSGQGKGALLAKRTPPGFRGFDVTVDGTNLKLYIRNDIAGAIAGAKNSVEANLIGNTLARGLGVFRYGAVTANVPFQITNAMLDGLRLGTMSQMGVRHPADLARFLVDYGHAMIHSFKPGNPTRTYIEAMQAGGLGGTLARQLSHDVGTFTPRLLQEKRSLPRHILDSPRKLSNAIEETAKLAGFIRAKRFFDLKTPEDLDRLATELLRYAGSPNFSRVGTAADKQNLESIYLMFPFINARIQDVSADLTRLFKPGPAGRTASVQAWGRLASLGAAASALHYHNSAQSTVTLEGPEGPWETTNAESYAQLQDWERDGYYLFPLSTYFVRVDERTGEKQRIRNYFRIQKRGVIGAIGNFSEGMLRYLADQDPEAYSRLGVSLSNIARDFSPINVSGGSGKEVLQSMGASLNPVVRAPFEVMTNTRFFQHREINPEFLLGEKTSLLPPEQVYRPDTPALWVKAAQNPVSRLLGLSPLDIQHGVNSFLGGLPNLMVPGEVEEGRQVISGLDQNMLGPLKGVTQRFGRSASLREGPQQERLRGFRQEAATERVALKQEALAFYEDNLSGKPVSEGLPIIKSVEDRDMRVELVQLARKRLNADTNFMRMFKGLSLRDRARFLARERMDNPQDYQALLQRIDREGMLIRVKSSTNPEPSDRQPFLDLLKEEIARLEGNQ